MKTDLNLRFFSVGSTLLFSPSQFSLTKILDYILIKMYDRHNAAVRATDVCLYS